MLHKKEEPDNKRRRRQSCMECARDRWRKMRELQEAAKFQNIEQDEENRETNKGQILEELIFFSPFSLRRRNIKHLILETLYIRLFLFFKGKKKRFSQHKKEEI